MGGRETVKDKEKNAMVAEYAKEPAEGGAVCDLRTSLNWWPNLLYYLESRPSSIGSDDRPTK